MPSPHTGGELQPSRDRLAGSRAVLQSSIPLPCSKIVREGDEAEVRAALGSIERECGAVLQGLPLHEPLFQLMCHGVPPGVKAAIMEVGGCYWCVCCMHCTCAWVGRGPLACCCRSCCPLSRASRTWRCAFWSACCRPRSSRRRWATSTQVRRRWLLTPAGAPSAHPLRTLCRTLRSATAAALTADGVKHAISSVSLPNVPLV